MRGRYRNFPHAPCFHICCTHSFPHYQHHSPECDYVCVCVHICKYEPTLLHIKLSKFIVYLRVHSWYCIGYGFRQMCNDIYSSLKGPTEYIHCPKNPLCSACTHLHHCPPATHTPHPSPITTERFILSIAVPFPECHIVRIMQYVAL